MQPQAPPASASMKGAAAVPASVRLQGKPLKDWSNADVLEWAKEMCPRVVQFLADYDGSILAGWRTEANFKEFLGGAYGAAFYGHLLDAGLLKTVLPEQPAPPAIVTLANALEGLSLKDGKPWKNATKDPPPFRIDSATSRWFSQYVRHDVIVELGKLMRSATDPLPINEWPDSRSIIYDTEGKPASVLRGFLKNFQDLEKPADKVPLWQSTLSALPKPDYSSSVSAEWEYLRALGRSSLLDIAVYEEFRGKGSLAAQNLSKVDQSYAAIVARNEATFKSTIPAEWQNSDVTKRYVNDLDYYSSLWHTINVEKTELELTGGPLSDLFDRFFRYVPRATLFAGAKYGDKFADVETFFTRGTRDPVEVVGLTGAADVLPDGRFVVRATANDDQQQLKREFSLVYIEDKKKAAVTDEDAVMYADRKTVLLEAQRSLISLVQFWKLCPEDAEMLCIPAVHTKWPKIWVYGVSFVRDGACVTKKIAEYDGLDAAGRPALKEMCLRILLLLKETLRVINAASPYDGNVRVGQLTTDAKHASGKSPTSTGSPGFSPAKPPESSGRGGPQHSATTLPFKGVQWRSDSVCIETVRCVWKLPTRNKEEKQILQVIGGHHYFPPVLDLPPSVAPPLGEAFALPYLPDRSVRSIDEARLLMANLAEALAFLHSLGYVHCDVKRSNVRFTGTEAFLIDLDSARPWRLGSAPLRGAVGTPPWRAPEACADDGLFTNKVDLYGLGLVLFDELLCLYFPDFWRVGEDTLDTEPDGIYSLLYRFAPHTALELICNLVTTDPARRLEAAQVLESPFISAGAAADHVKHQDHAPTLDVFLRRSKALIATCASGRSFSSSSASARIPPLPGWEHSSSSGFG